MELLIGRKLGMTRFFREDGKAVPATLVELNSSDPGIKEGDKIKISGISKGKGFQGVVKRHGFSGLPASHGHKGKERTPGSIGQRFPQHTLKGKRMAGRMGGEKVTVKNLEVIKIDKDLGLVAIRGAVPGRRGTKLNIKYQKSI